MSGNGAPLPTALRQQMEASFGTDFSDVRVHTDASSAPVASLNARAYTKGSDIYFNAGQYNPESQEGRRLLGHELAHVVQQRSGVQLNGQVMQSQRELSGHLAASGEKAAVK